MKIQKGENDGQAAGDGGTMNDGEMLRRRRLPPGCKVAASARRKASLGQRKASVQEAAQGQVSYEGGAGDGDE